MRGGHPSLQGGIMTRWRLSQEALRIRPEAANTTTLTLRVHPSEFTTITSLEKLPSLQGRSARSSESSERSNTSHSTAEVDKQKAEIDRLHREIAARDAELQQLRAEMQALRYQSTRATVAGAANRRGSTGQCQGVCAAFRAAEIFPTPGRLQRQGPTGA